MTNISYSFIIPVYNRPNEITELLQSFANLVGEQKFEIIIVEDGSTSTSEAVVNQFNQQLNIRYFFKTNSGPGDSRNFGMKRANGNYFIILDSDVILPSNYLIEVDTFLNNKFYHCFGGPDDADASFSNLQKAVNFAMTSILSTGGVRGSEKTKDNFQPRSFNLGLSKEAFKATKGFGKIHPGEDPDLVLRLWGLGYKTTFIKHAKVFHKRRVSWEKFLLQVYKFGSVRPILNKWHPNSKKLTYWFPTLFLAGFLISVILASLGSYHLITIYCIYFFLIFISALISTKSVLIALMSVWAVCIQFYGYGKGFLRSSVKLMISNKPVEEIFPKLFFK